jgi:hypothetical protein
MATMRLTLNRSGVVTGLGGAALVASLAVVRSLASATENTVFWMGSELHWECSFRQQFGIPCPACGMTRSVLLTLHGFWRSALEVNPGGPLLVLGVLLLGATLFAASFRSLTRARPWPDAVFRRMTVAASIYGGLVSAVLLGHWVRAIM